MRIRPMIYGVIVLTVFLGIILGFQSAGIWSISGKITSSGEKVQPSAADVNTIKGWMTLEQISTTFNVPMADILKQFDLPTDTAPSTAIKDLETDLFSVTNLRTWLQSRTQPVEIAAPAALALKTTDEITPAPTDHVVADEMVTGSTTLQNLLDWGVPIETIQKVIGGELLAPTAVIKDTVVAKGLEFSSIKALLQAEVDKMK
jgi:hypothetical protein